MAQQRFKLADTLFGGMACCGFAAARFGFAFCRRGIQACPVFIAAQAKR